MAPAEPCDVPLCPALACDGDGFCEVHKGARQLRHVMVGQRCLTCQRLLEKGDWITRDSTLEATEHAMCPKKRVWPGRKKDRAKPLIELAEELQS